MPRIAPFRKTFSRPVSSGVKAGPDLEQRTDPAGDVGPAGARLGNPREDFQQRRLAGAVVADQADRFAALDREGDLAERPEDVDLGLVSFAGLPAPPSAGRLR